MTDKDNITIRFSRDTRLEQALRYANVYQLESVRKLTVTGTVCGWNIREILEKMGKTLQELDFSSTIMDNSTYLSCYKDCPALLSISFPESIDSFPAGIFKRLNNLTNIEIHPAHPKYVVENSIVFSRDKTKLVRFPAGRKGEYTVPDTVKKVGSDAFSGCKRLTSVTIPKSVTSLGYNAFADCTELTSVDMHKSLKYKQNKVFENCKKLPQFIETQNVILKQEKIKKIQGTSAHDWVDNLLKNSKYPYKIETYKTKLQLSIKINARLKLEMPISLKHFQTIVPKLMATIQRYDECINESEMEILVEKVAYDNRYWKNEKRVKNEE